MVQDDSLALDSTATFERELGSAAIHLRLLVVCKPLDYVQAIPGSRETLSKCFLVSISASE